MSQEPSTDSIEDLARRLRRVERFLAARSGYDDPGISPSPLPPPMPNRVDEPPIATVVPHDDPRWDAGPVPNLSVAAPLEPHVIDDRGYAIPAAEFERIYPPTPRAAEVPVAVSEGVTRPPTVPPPMPRRDAGGFERLVGLKLAGWVGAIVLVIGAALGVKFAYDQGWLGNVPDGVRLGLLYAAGFAIVGLGELIYRRVGMLASVGVFGAGIAILFVVGYAGDAYFNLYGQRVAFALMAGAAIIGALVSYRAQLASIAVLSLVGANLAPALLGHSAAGETTLLVYLLALQLLALGLAHVGVGDRWWSLRSLSLATTAFWIAVRLVDSATTNSTPTIAFTLVYFALFQIEAALAARKATWTWPQRLGSFAGFSATATVCLTIAVLAWGESWSHARMATTLVGMAMLAITAGAAGLAATKNRLHAGAERTRAAPAPADDAASEPGRRDYALPRREGATQGSDEAFRNLAVGWIGQGLTLIVLAVPIALDGPAVLIGWLGLAVLYAAMGVVGRRPGTAFAGAIVWGIAVAGFALGSYDHLSSIVLFTLGGISITQAFAMTLLLAATGHGIAMLLASPRLDAPDTWLGRLAWPAEMALPTLATVLVIAVAFDALPPLAATVAVAALAWATSGLARVERRRDVAVLAVVVAAFAVGKWLLVDELAARLNGRPMAGMPIVNATMGVGLAVTASALALTLMRSRLRRTGIPACLNAGGEAVLSGEGTAARAETRQAGMPVLRSAESENQLERLIAVGLAIGVMTIALCCEFQAAGQRMATGTAWPAGQLALLAQTALITLVALTFAPLQRAIAPRAADAGRVRRACGWAIVVLAAKFAVVDSLAFAFDDAVWLVRPILNVQAAVGAGVVAACWIVARRNVDAAVAIAAGACVAIVPLIAGSIEVARAVGPDRTLVGLSVFWAAYAAVAIAVGFALRGGFALRIGGLSLLAVTILKVAFVDLANAGTGWRILSFLAVGVLLLATSVLYGKFGDVLRREPSTGVGFDVGEKIEKKT